MALADTPVVLLTGARQVGKSTLAQTLGRGGHAVREEPVRGADVRAVGVVMA